CRDKQTSGLTQARTCHARQTLRPRIHQHVGSQSIGDKSESQFSLWVSEPDAATRPGMTEGTWPHSESGIGHLGLIQPAPQRKAGARQKSAVLSDTVFARHFGKQHGIEQIAS